MSNLLYVYAILPATAAAVQTLDRAAIRGIDGGGVTTVTAEGLAAAVSEVAAPEFEAEPLNRLVRSMDWLAPRAALHQHVNAYLFDRADALIPLAFGTIYRDAERIIRMLETEARALSSCLDRVRGRAEWVVSLERHTDQALVVLEQQNDALRDLRDRIAAGAPGRAYLLSRQVDGVRRRELLGQDGQAVAALETLLSGVEDAFTETLEAGMEHGLLARLSLLVHRRQESDWLAAVDRYRVRWLDLGYDLRVTGPWPPYRFSSRGAELLSAGR